MDIQSAFESGVQGFQQAQNKANTAADTIAKSTALSADAYSNQQQNNDAVEAPKEQPANEPNLTQSMVDLKVAEFQGKASANVIKTADDALGNILDISV